MGLTVITFTRNERPELLKRCMDSVERALPSGAKYKIYECLEDFQQHRFEQYFCDDFVAFVDDDDEVHKDAIKWCYDAILNTGAGLAFTDEIRVLEDGTHIEDTIIPRTYYNLTVQPRVAHHLCIVRQTAIDKRCLGLIQKYEQGIEWFTKVSAASSGGAIHVPKVGYFWTAWQGREGNVAARSGKIFSKTIHDIGKDLRSMWPVRDGNIPTYYP